jgi:hypothetical protein
MSIITPGSGFVVLGLVIETSVGLSAMLVENADLGFLTLSRQVAIS